MTTKRCFTCKEILPYEKRRNKYCNHSCAAKISNIGIRRHGRSPTKCLVCGKNTKSWAAKYCSRQCYHEAEYQLHINLWKTGKITGLAAPNNTVISPVKRYLRKKFGNKCCLCGWSKINPYTKKVPLVADHIDGNYKNNKEENLRLICWNCDSLGSTFGALNKGNGRRRLRI